MIAPLLTVVNAALTAMHNWPFHSQDIGSSGGIGSSIRIAHCRSICLVNHAVDGIRCTNYTIFENHCLNCWRECRTLGEMEEERRSAACSEYYDWHRKENKIPNPAIVTACQFYDTRGAEKDKYEPSKLPAPERCKVIRMKVEDVAVTMRRNYKGRWLEDNYHSGHEISALALSAGAWIVVASKDGTLKQYSWEIWKPKLESLKENFPLYQAHITWTDWQAQLEQQLDEFQRFNPEIEIGSYEWNVKPSFVVTWQYEKGDGIMGNQVTNSESANISLPSNSKYLVRITTNDSPGSYPIVVDTHSRVRNLSSWEKLLYQSLWWFIMIWLSAFIICLFYCLFYLSQQATKKFNKSFNNPKKLAVMEEGRLEKPTKESDIFQVHQSFSETIMNANLQTMITNSQKAQSNSRDINANLQDANAKRECETYKT